MASNVIQRDLDAAKKAIERGYYVIKDDDTGKTYRVPTKSMRNPVDVDEAVRQAQSGRVPTEPSSGMPSSKAAPLAGGFAERAQARIGRGAAEPLAYPKEAASTIAENTLGRIPWAGTTLAWLATTPIPETYPELAAMVTMAVLAPLTGGGALAMNPTLLRSIGQRALQVGGPALMAALTSRLTGQGVPGEEAGKAALGGGVGVGLSAAKGTVSRYGGAVVNTHDVEAVSTALRTIRSKISGRVNPMLQRGLDAVHSDATQLLNAVSGKKTGLQHEMSTIFDRGMNRIYQTAARGATLVARPGQTPGPMIGVAIPELKITADMQLKDAFQRFWDFKRGHYHPETGLTMGGSRRAILATIDIDARKTLTQALDRMSPGLGAEFGRLNELYAQGGVVKDLLRTAQGEGGFAKGKLDLNVVRDLVEDPKWRSRLEEALGPRDFNRVMSAVYRSPDWASQLGLRDQPLGGLGASGHLPEMGPWARHIRAFMHFALPTRYTGEVPRSARIGGVRPWASIPAYGAIEQAAQGE